MIEKNVEKIRDYVDSWNLFRMIWEMDIDQFMTMYRSRGLELDEFEGSMTKYFDVSNQVLMQDTVTTVTFVVLNSSKLKKVVLEYIAKWKKSYKETLCATAVTKMDEFYAFTKNYVSQLSIKPYQIEQLENMLKIHKKLIDEMSQKEKDMKDINKYFTFLGLYLFILKIYIFFH